MRKKRLATTRTANNQWMLRKTRCSHSCQQCPHHLFPLRPARDHPGSILASELSFCSDGNSRPAPWSSCNKRITLLLSSIYLFFNIYIQYMFPNLYLFIQFISFRSTDPDSGFFPGFLVNRTACDARDGHYDNVYRGDRSFQIQTVSSLYRRCVNRTNGVCLIKKAE